MRAKVAKLDPASGVQELSHIFWTNLLPVQESGCAGIACCIQFYADLLSRKIGKIYNLHPPWTTLGFLENDGALLRQCSEDTPCEALQIAMIMISLCMSTTFTFRQRLHPCIKASTRLGFWN